MRLILPAICIMTRARGNRGSPERGRLLDRLSLAARAGATMIVVRERQLDDRRLLDFITEVGTAVRPHGSLVLVNDRTDLAILAGADGVHLKSDSPRAADVRRIVSDEFIIGRSIHSLAEAEATVDAGGCDYLLFGTVFPSRSKADDHPVTGIEPLQHVCNRVHLPVLAIGGMTEARAAQVAAAGASGVAAISLFTESHDIQATVSGLRSALTGSEGSV